MSKPPDKVLGLVHNDVRAGSISKPLGEIALMPWTYILECADGSFYVGSTVNLEARLWQHNEGLGASYTRPRRRRPVKVAWAGEFARVDEAFAFEKQVQGWSRKKRIALIENRLEDLPALATRHTRSTFTQWEAEQANKDGD